MAAAPSIARHPASASTTPRFLPRRVTTRPISQPSATKGGSKLAAGSTLFARLAKLHLRPVVDRRAQIPGIAGEEHRDAVMVLGQRAEMAVTKPVELAALAVEPARRFVGHVLEPRAEIVFCLQPRLQHIEL